MSLVYRLYMDGPSIILTNEVLTILLRHRQAGILDKESGGQLFATFNGHDAIVVMATTPKGRDKRTRYGFIPNRWLQNLEIKTYHRQGKHFVGDWHTHPQPVPVPSSDDVKSMVDCFRKSRHELEAFLMVIVGTAEPPEGLLVCLVNEAGIVPLALSPVSPDAPPVADLSPV